MAENHISSSQLGPTYPNCCTPFRQVPKWMGIVATILIAPGLLIWTARMLYHKEECRKTKMHFLAIAVGFESYSDSVAQVAFERLHPPSSTGLLLKDVPWGAGHLPFPVRRAGVNSSSDWLLQNGEGEPLYSWRIELLPFLESLPKPWDVSQHWNAESKRELLRSYGFFSYDQRNASSTTNEIQDDAIPEANALAITGPRTAFGDGSKSPMSLRDVPPDTILVVESRASGIPWPAPGDFDIRTMPQTINAPDGKGISSLHDGGFHVIFADRQVWRLSNNVPFEVLKRFFTATDAENRDRETLLAPYVMDRAP